MTCALATQVSMRNFDGSFDTVVIDGAWPSGTPLQYRIDRKGIVAAVGIDRHWLSHKRVKALTVIEHADGAITLVLLTRWPRARRFFRIVRQIWSGRQTRPFDDEALVTLWGLCDVLSLVESLQKLGYTAHRKKWSEVSSATRVA